MSIAQFAINRRITTVMITLGIAVFGWFSLKKLEIKLLPEISYPSITIRTEFPGAPPEEVENLIAKPIEEALGTINNLQDITSISSAGLSDVIIQFNWNTSMDKVIMDIREKLDSLLFPDSAGKPRILRYNPETEPMMKLALTGENPIRTYQFADQEIKPRLETLEGVAACQILGGEKEEIRIEIDTAKLTAMNITLDQIARRLSQENINLPGGILEDGNVQYLVRTVNEFQSESDVEDIIIDTPGKGQVHIKDIGQVTRSVIDKKTITHISGKENVLIEIFKEGDANVIDVAENIADALGESSHELFEKRRSIRSLLPDSMSIEIVADQSVFIKAAIAEVKNTAVSGCILAILVLFLFLKNLPHTSIIGLAIPISIISTFSLMYFKNITLNLMSLGGLALGIGMLVDNAIVVLENIFRRKEQGEPIRIAAQRGTEEVSAAVTASTLTTIAVFFPIIFVSGVAGQIFKDLAYTIAFSLLASLVIALSLIPMISSLHIDVNSRTDRYVWSLEHYLEYRIRDSSGKRSIRFFFGFIFSVFRATMFFSGQMIRKSGQNLSKPPAVQQPVLRWIVMGFLFPIRLIYEIIECLFRSTGFLLTNGIFCASLFLFTLIAMIWRLIRVLLIPVFRIFDFVNDWSRSIYIRLLEWSLTRPSVLIILSFILLITSIVFILPRIGTDLIPAMSQGTFTIDLKMPVGTPLTDTEKITQQIENMASTLPEIDYISTIIGAESSSGSNLGTEQENLASLQITLKPECNNRETETMLMDQFRTSISRIPGVEKAELHRPALFTLKTPLEVELRGENLEILYSNAQRLLERLKQESQFTDCYSTLERGYPEIQITFDRVKLAHHAIAPNEIADMLRNELEGTIPTEMGSGKEMIDIRIRGQKKNTHRVDSLKNLIINPQSEFPVQLGSVSEIIMGVGPSEIRRVDQRRVALIRCDVRLIDLQRATHQMEGILQKIPPDPGISYAIVGQNIEMNESIANMKMALSMAVFLVYLVMASQFESLIHPLIILFSIPLALIGVIWGLWLLQIPISIVVFIGMIVLAGIVVNNAIILIDTINGLRQEGHSITDAVVKSGEQRWRPILMTALTTILGLIPMALEQGPGVEIRAPLAITIILGLITSTVLTLVIIPTIYHLLYRSNPEPATGD